VALARGTCDYKFGSFLSTSENCSPIPIYSGILCIADIYSFTNSFWMCVYSSVVVCVNNEYQKTEKKI